MKKVKQSIIMTLLCIYCSSCATVFGGHVTQAQRTKPKAGEPSRAVRGGALVADLLLFWPGLIIDFADCAIYKP